MSELTETRDHCRRMAKAEHKPGCPAAKRTGFVRSGCDAGPNGCNPPADRALFAQLADEIDAHLAPDPDQPTLEDV